MKSIRRRARGLFLVYLASVVGCGNGGGGGGGGDASGTGGPQSGTSGGSREIVIDGSSTVEPISKAVAESFSASHPDVRVGVGRSGTSGGFAAFLRNETDINDASRPIKQSEIDLAAENGIEYVELKIAIDGLTVVVNPENDWCDAMTIGQLRRIWEPGSQVTKWIEIDPSWPDEEIGLWGPDSDSGTFDYFTGEVCGEEGACRSDYNPSVDDNQLVRGVAGDKYALGYFGYAYYVENQSALKALAIAPDKEATSVAGAVLPTPETIESGEYTPLSRPLFIYVNLESLKKPQVVDFVQHYLSEEGLAAVVSVGYVPLSSEQIAESRAALQAAIDGAGTSAE